LGEKGDAYRVLMGKPEGRYHLEDIDIDGKAIIKCIIKKWDTVAWAGLIWFRIEARLL
jgi:hypothetical protein